MGCRARQGGGGEDRAEGRPDARRPGDREGHPGDQRTALAGARHQSVDVPLDVEPGHERAATNSTPIAMITPPAIFSSVSRCS